MSQEPRFSANRPLLSRDAYIPIGLAIAVVLAATGGVWSFSQVLSQFQSEQALKFQRLELKLDAVERTLAESTVDRWRRADMAQWADVLAAKNPSLNVPAIK